MNIQYVLNLDDVIAYHSYLWEHNTKIKQTYTVMTRILIAFGIVLLVLTVIDVRVLNADIWVAVVNGVLGVCAILFAAFWPKLWRRITMRSIMKRYSRKPPRVIGKHELSITSEGVTDIDEIEPSFARWDEIVLLASNGKYLFLLTSGPNFHIVPQRAFSDQASFGQFVETAKRYYRGAKPQQ
jgi:hypothetical protein